MPRNGRNVRYDHIKNGLSQQLGLSDFLIWFFTYPIFLERPSLGNLSRMTWKGILTWPIDFMVRGFALRPPGQKDSEGEPCLNLDQLGLHGVIEHDISLVRWDFAQGDNTSVQPDLIAELLGSSSNGKTITKNDFVQLRRKRYLQQKADNPDLDFDGPMPLTAYCEVALILNVIGDSDGVPIEYLKAFIDEERLPRKEGWKLTRRWSFGLLEMNFWALKFMKLMGPLGTPPKKSW